MFPSKDQRIKGSVAAGGGRPFIGSIAPKALKIERDSSAEGAPSLGSVMLNESFSQRINETLLTENILEMVYEITVVSSTSAERDSELKGSNNVRYTSTMLKETVDSQRIRF